MIVVHLFRVYTSAKSKEKYTTTHHINTVTKINHLLSTRSPTIAQNSAYSASSTNDISNPYKYIQAAGCPATGFSTVWYAAWFPLLLHYEWPPAEHQGRSSPLHCNV